MKLDEREIIKRYSNNNISTDDEFIKLDYENLKKNNYFLENELKKMQSKFQQQNNYEVIENRIEQTNTGMTKKETEENLVKILFQKIEIERLSQKINNFFS